VGYVKPSQVCWSGECQGFALAVGIHKMQAVVVVAADLHTLWQRMYETRHGVSGKLREQSDVRLEPNGGGRKEFGWTFA
jgi:hypothetical protein